MIDYCMDGLCFLYVSYHSIADTSYAFKNSIPLHIL